MKKITKLFLPVLLMFSLMIPTYAIVKDNGQYCNDDAGILSSQTEQTINQKASLLDEKSGAQICVVTVDFTDGKEIEDYAYELFNSWGIGDKQKNNGMLILVVPGQNDYWIMPGSGTERIISNAKLSDIIYENNMNDAVDNDAHYDESILGVFNDIYTEMDLYYGVNTNTSSTKDSILSFVATLIMVIVFFSLISGNYSRRRYSYGPRGFRPYYRPYHTIRPHGPSSFSSSHRSSNSFGGSRSGGGFRGGGGGSRGGGVGRH